jgi:hypothetical protein
LNGRSIWINAKLKLVQIQEYFDNKYNKKIPLLLITLTVAIVPSLLTIGLIRFLLHSSPYNFIPVDPNDLTNYWHEAYSFSQVGFNSGVYGPNEHIAPINFFRFDVHGPFYAIIYGFIGHFIGWEFYTSMLINVLILALGIFLFVWITRPKPSKIVIAGIVIVTIWIVVFYLPVPSQETMHQSAALVFAAIFYQLLVKRDKVSIFFKGMSLVFILLMAWMRISWGVLLIPFFVLISPRKLSYLLLSLFISVILISILWISYRSIIPPADYSITKVTDGFRSSMSSGLSEIVNLLYNNILDIKALPLSITMFILYQAVGVLLIIMINTYSLFRLYRKKILTHLADIKIEENFFHILNLLPIIIGSFTIYMIGGADRVIGSHLLLSLILFVCFDRYKLAIAIISIQLLFSPISLQEYRRILGPNFSASYTPREIIDLREKLSRTDLIYDPNAPVPWCNTVLIPGSFYHERALTIPAGFGINVFRSEMELSQPIKSQYVMATRMALDKMEVKGEFRLKLVRELPFGHLYQNLDSDCSKNNR